MRKLPCLLLLSFCFFFLLGSCATSAEEDESNWARRPMILVEDTLYFDTGIQLDVTVDPAVVLGSVTSTVDVSEIPAKEGQSNFGQVGAQYAYYEDGLLLLIDDGWYYFETETAQTVAYNGSLFDTSELSEETVQWLAWYSDLPEEEQVKISMVPPELINSSGEDAQPLNTEF